MKKKVVLVITGMMLGGAERVLSTIANYLAEEGYDVTLVSFKNEPSSYKLSPLVNFKTLGIKLINKNIIITKIQDIINMPIIIFRYYKIIKEVHPDVILSFLTRANYTVAIFKKIIFKNVYTIVSERADPTQRNKIDTFLVNKLYKYPDKVVCQSAFVHDYFFENGIKSENLCIIFNPLNEESYFTGAIGQFPKVNEIVAVGRLHESKNFSLLIKSIKLIKDQLQGYKVKIIGQGPNREILQNEIDSLLLSDLITLTGPESYPLKKNFRAKLFVSTSLNEGFPNVIIEAMASGLPVISTDFPTGVSKSLIKNEINGFVTTYSEKEISEKILAVLNDDNLSNQMSMNNIAIRNIFSKENIMNEWKKLMRI